MLAKDLHSILRQLHDLIEKNLSPGKWYDCTRRLCSYKCSYNPTLLLLMVSTRASRMHLLGRIRDPSNCRYSGAPYRARRKAVIAHSKQRLCPKEAVASSASNHILCISMHGIFPMLECGNSTRSKYGEWIL
jgi:hypothetical protein